MQWAMACHDLGIGFGILLLLRMADSLNHSFILSSHSHKAISKYNLKLTP